MSNPILIALTQYGVAETQKGDNPIILNYSKESGIEGIDSDETSWCAIFANWVCFKANLERSHSPAARSWLNVGTEVKEPEMGDVVVFWRGDPQGWQGHVAFFINYSADRQWVNVIGGNQGDRVCIQAMAINRILGFRRLKQV